MANLQHTDEVPTIDADAAHEEATRAAASAGVVIRSMFEPVELDAMRATIESVWGPEVVPPRNVLRGLSLGGAGLMLALRDGEAIGFSLGWLGWNRGVHFHSHQVGVLPGVRGAGVGFALKLAQRAECLRHDITEMRWTYDPVVATVASFNLLRLGTTVLGFLPNCYGERRDAFNTGDITDRLEVSWRLDTQVGGHSIEPVGHGVIVVPADYQQLRDDDPAQAKESRRRVGEQLAGLFSAGGSIVGLGRQHGDVVYVVASKTTD
jgi:predicted GNAT superfamily acetyltransferase